MEIVQHGASCAAVLVPPLEPPPLAGHRKGATPVVAGIAPESPSKENEPEPMEGFSV